MQVQCEILKTNRMGGRNAGHFDCYTIEAASNDTVLDVLMSIYQQYDSNLAFRFACGIARCGECGLLVNGEPCMACDQTVEQFMRIEPLNNLPVVKDTVIDRRHVFNQIQRILPPAENADLEALVGLSKEESRDRIENTIRMTTCFECMICESSCPRYLAGVDFFPGPLGLLFLAQRQQNPAAIPVSKEAVKRVTAFCARCGKCMKYCPADKNPLELALKLLGCTPKKYLRISIGENKESVVEIQKNQSLKEI